MKFTFDLESLGWASVYLKINDQEQYFSPSYVTEPLIDLLDAIMSLMTEFTPEDELKTYTSFEWDLEPAIVAWNLKRMKDDQLLVTIDMFREGFRELEGRRLGERILSEQCRIVDFLHEIVSSLDMLVVKYGFVGYRENWSRADFPIGRYLKLKNYVLNDKPIDVEKVNEGEWNEYKRTRLENELRMIMNLFKDDF